MRLTIRLVGVLVLCVLLVSVFSSYYQVQRERRSLQKELHKRAELVAESLQQNAETMLAARAVPQLRRLVDRFGNKDRLIGIAIYADGEPLAATASLGGLVPAQPPTVANAIQEDKGNGEFRRVGLARLHLYAVPLHGEPGVLGGLLVVHDASHIAAYTRHAWRDMSVRVLVQIFLIALTTVVIFQRNVVKPIARTAAWMRDLRHGHTPAESSLPESDVTNALAREANNFAKSLTAARASAAQEARLREEGESSWTAERLAVSLRTKLKDSRLFIVSNREPYMHTRKGKSIEALVPASGLVTALEPILRACDGTWVAHGSGDADRDTVNKRNCLRVPPDDPRYTLRRVWLSKEEEEGYYLGFSNEGLWPLCHIAHTRPIFRARDWEHYKAVNAKFAEAALEEMSGTEQPVVIVQDYHFALLPRLIKEARPDARVGIFWHIPWPNPEAFGICPWQRELLEGLLGADLVGFHIQSHCDNFLETVNRVLEARVEWDRFAVNRRCHLTLVRPYPISVVFPDPSEAADHQPTHKHQALLLEELGAKALYLGVGVDRVDYTKGILERFLAIERLLDKYPQYIGKFSFVQIGAPSRANVRRYQEFLAEVDAEAARINARFQYGKWQPIIYRKRHHTHAEVERFYRAADLCLVTSLHDGMNLVAKEYVASRHDADGVLILSPFTGAARELPDALIVNPYDTESLAQAIFSALEMDPRERNARMRRMREIVRQQNVYRWAGNLIGELCGVRLANEPSPLRQRQAAGLLSAAAATGGQSSEAVRNELIYNLGHPGAVGAGRHQVSAVLESR